MKSEKTYKLAVPSDKDKHSRIFVIRNDKNVRIYTHDIEIKNALKKEKKRLKLRKKLEKLKAEAEKCPHIICVENAGWMCTDRMCIACGALVDEL